MPKIDMLVKPSPGLKGIKGVKGVKDRNTLIKEKEFDKEVKTCYNTLKKLKRMEGDQDEDQWETFLGHKGEDKIVKVLKERANISQVWYAVCDGDGDATLEMFQGIDFVLKHNFMPTTGKEAKDLAFMYPSVAFRVIADDSSLASLKVRALLALDPENESAFKLKMREWYENHEIDVASQATFDYIQWKEAEEAEAAPPRPSGGKGAAGKGIYGFFTASERADERKEHSRRLAAMDEQIAAEAAQAAKEAAQAEASMKAAIEAAMKATTLWEA